MSAFASAPAEGADRFGKRLVLARRLVLATVAMVPFMCVVTALLAASETGRGDAKMVPLAWRAPHPLDVALVTAGILCSAVLAYFLLRIVRTRVDRPDTTLDRDVLLSVVALGGAVLTLAGNNWTLGVVLAWGSGVCVTGSRRRRAGYLLIMLLASVLPSVVLGWPGEVAQGVVFALGLTAVALVAWVVTWASYASVIVLWDIITEATAAREAQARLAVSEERLRFARDMHDLLGHSLSGMAVKSELAARLAERDPQRAAREMTAVQRLARDALRELRTAVSGYREVDLDAEIAGVRAVLSAAGVRCEVTGGAVDLPAELRSLAAWLVREAATNVLRHSSAARCAITLEREENAVLVEVFNDGVRGAGEAAVRFGNGLTGLAERAAAAGGSVTASPSGRDGFLVRAVLPLAPREAGQGAPTASGRDREDVTA